MKPFAQGAWRAEGNGKKQRCIKQTFAFRVSKEVSAKIFLEGEIFQHILPPALDGGPYS